MDTIAAGSAYPARQHADGEPRQQTVVSPKERGLLISGGVETNAFALLDEDSDLMELHPGDNVLTADAASGREGLQASISFYPMVVGILPEVMK